MKQTTWQPFREGDQLFRRFGNVLPESWVQPRRVVAEPHSWTPAAAVTETDDEYLVNVAVPGVKPGEIWVQVEKGVLKVRVPKPLPALPEA